MKTAEVFKDLDFIATELWLGQVYKTVHCRLDLIGLYNCSLGQPMLMLIKCLSWLAYLS